MSEAVRVRFDIYHDLIQLTVGLDALQTVRQFIYFISVIDNSGICEPEVKEL